VTSVASQDVVDNFELCHSHPAVGFILLFSFNTRTVGFQIRRTVSHGAILKSVFTTNKLKVTRI
jgi:hypothetical protein